MATDPSSLFTIDGTVVDPEGSATAGVRVVAADVIDTAQTRPRVLVSSTTDADGRFSLVLSAEDALRLFRSGGDQERGQPSRPMASRGRAIAIVAYSRGAVVGRLDLTVTLDGLADGYDVQLITTRTGEAISMLQGQHQATGVVRDETGRPIAAIQVEVIQVRLRDEVVLASGLSGSDGSFRLSYDAASHLGEGAKALAVALRVLADDGSGELVERARSERFCPAPAMVNVDLVLPPETIAGSEIERIAATIDARREGLPWGELTDDDVELIACETGLPLSQVTTYARAARLADAASLPVEALYALGRRGMTMSVSAVGALPSAVVERELLGAADQGLVPSWDDASTTASQVASVMGTRAAADEAEAPLGQLLATVGLPAAVRESFVVGYVGRPDTVQRFWQDFAASHTPDEVEQTKFSLTTGALTQGHLPLVVELEQRRQAGDLSSPRDLAGMTVGDWRALVSGKGGEPGTGAPAGYPGQDDAERELLYATALARAAEEAFPTASLVKRAAKLGRFGLAASYVDEHHELDFRSTNARQFLTEHPPAGLTTEQQDQLRTELSQAQRLFMVAPRFDRDVVASALLDAGIHSAHQIVGMGPSAFVERHGEALGGEAIAKVVYDNAHHVTSTLAVLAMNLGGPFNPTTVPAVGGKTAEPGDAPPDLEHLLGPMDYCACDHCRSVLSPAAYLVDLLRFLEQRPAVADEGGGGAAVEPFAALTARRPDLLHTLLDCANTNTPLPTIDLVNEILEREVAGMLPAQWPQTTRTTAELRAQPEHRLDAAYDTLRNAVYPWSLPFDLARAEADAFLVHLGVPRVELLQTCGAPSVALDDAIARARLGLEELTAQIIADEHPGVPPAPHELWGVDAAQWPGLLEDVSSFIERAGLEYEQLPELVATSYAGAGLLEIAFAQPCRLEGATIGGLDDSVLSRIHRFLRLWRALGWTMADVDLAIANLGSGPAPVDLAFLRSLSRAIALGESFQDLPRREWLAWFGDLPTEPRFGEARSDFEEVFVERTPEGEISPLSPASLSGDIVDVAPHVAAALSVTEEELSLLLSLDAARAPATVGNLSWLLRWSSLSRALGLSIRDVVTLAQLSGVVPFQVTGAAALDALETFVDQARVLRRAGVSVASVDALLRHRGPHPVGVPEAALASVLVELVRGLQAIGRELDAAVDPSRSARAVLPEQLVRVMPEDEVGLVLQMVSTIPTSAPGGYEPVPASAQVFVAVGTWNSLQDDPPDGTPMEDPEHRARLVLDELVAYLRVWLGEGVVVNKLAAAMGLSAGSVEALLDVDDDGSPMMRRFVGTEPELASAIDFASQGEALADPLLPQHIEEGTGGFPSLAPHLDALRWLAKSVGLVEQLGLGDDDLRWLLTDGATHGLLSPVDIPTQVVDGPSAKWPAWLLLQRFASFGRTHTSGLPGLRDVLDAGSEVRSVLARVTGWEDPSVAPADSAIEVVATQRGISEADLRTMDGLEQIARALDLAQRLGVTAARATNWATTTPTTSIARDVQAAAKAKVSSEAWPRVVEPLRDSLRKRQRDALVAYVLANDPESTTPEALFGRLLIDVEVSPCAKTSRIKQAISSVQTFVQRVLLSKEPGVNISAAATTEWQWMSRYRVWEANRKIFLWPENWLQPELRDDKTELFEAFQSALLDGQLDDDVAEAAVSSYLRSMAEIARLHVAGMVHERELADAEAIAVDRLHVFGRTKVRPYRYFHRTRIDDSEWTPWEELPFTIDAESVLPAIVRRRLVLAWVTVQGRSKGEGSSPPRAYHELRLSWCMRDHEGWGQVRTAAKTANDMGIEVQATASLDGLAPPPPVAARAANESEIFYRVHSKSDGSLTIAPGFPALAYDSFCFSGRFRFRDVEEEPVVATVPHDRRTRPDTSSPQFAGGLPRPKAMIPRQQWYVMDSSNYGPADIQTLGLQVPVRSVSSGTYSYQRLFDTPHPFTVSATTQYEEFSSESPMVYQDSRRSLLITPRPPVLQTYFVPWGGDRGPALVGLGGLAHASFVPSATRTEDLLGGAPETSDVQEDPMLTEPGPVAPTPPTALEPWEQWTFEVSAFDHPLARRLVDLVRRHGVPALYRPPAEGVWASFDRQLVQESRSSLYGLGQPENTASGSVLDEIDFSPGGSYSVYNWELFFHVPMLVALRLMEDKKFEQARRWMHCVFDPTAGGTTPTPSRYWKVRPLFETTVTDVAEQLEALHYEGDDSAKKKLRDDTRDQIARWRRNPFRPHSLAKLRISAYQRWVVMRYLDNLIEWGDHLFSQDTIESNNEALQLYVLAAQLLGPRPVMLPERDAAAMSYAEVQGAFDDFSNFLAQAENAVPSAMLDTKKAAAATKLAGGALSKTPLQGAHEVVASGQLPMAKHPVMLAQLVGYTYVSPAGSEAPTLYFCVPHNQELLRYWDVVADRLFKLRHCMNIEGEKRQFPLFQPPIDPGLLAKAVASGVDVSAALSDVGAPRPHYRFSTMLSLAKELAAEVRGFGSSLADALRSADAETLAELRATQEAEILEISRQVREQRIEEAQQAIVSLERAKEVVVQRRDYYASLPARRMGGAFDASAAMLGQSRKEKQQLDDLAQAKRRQAAAMVLDSVSAGIGMIPQFEIGSSGNGLHVVSSIGGQQLAVPFHIGSLILSRRAQRQQIEATIAGTSAGYERRLDEWTFQVEQATAEIARIEQDIVTARLRLAIAKRDLVDHDTQVANAQHVDAYLRDRYTNAELYRWLGSELSRSYFQAYQLAFEIAKQAQRCYQHDLGLPRASFIEFGYWDNRRKGLLAGERLLHDLRRMETSYLANNRREYELTKRVSLARIDPFALLRLRAEGSCDIHLPEVLFELDHPSHYMRRIRSVRLSIVGNTGPYDTVGATLTLTRSEVRTSTSSYSDPEQPVVETGGATQSIATSTGTSDAGLFEANLRDERYLPFEGRGAVSQWSLSLPKALRTFDYEDIADVVLEMQLTAREGGQAFAAQVEGPDGAGLRARLDSGGLGSQDYGTGRMWGWSAAARFPDAWASLRQPAPGEPYALALALGREHYPHPLTGSSLTVQDVFVIVAGGSVTPGTTVMVTSPGGNVPMDGLAADPNLPGLLVAGRSGDPPLPIAHSATGDWTITLGDVPDPAVLRDLIVIVRYTEGA